MKVNVFEGFRRISWFLQFAIVGGAALYGVLSDPYVRVTFATTGPEKPFLLTEGPCAYPSRSEYLTVPMSSREASITLCFEAITLKSGTKLIPYSSGNPPKYFGSEYPYGAEIDDYVKARAAQFAVSPDDEAKIESQFRAKQWGQWKDAALTAGGGWLALYLFTALMGWIVRGFMGIPGGKDSRDG